MKTWFSEIWEKPDLIQSYMEFLCFMVQKYILNLETAHMELDNCESAKPRIEK